MEDFCSQTGQSAQGTHADSFFHRIDRSHMLELTAISAFSLSLKYIYTKFFSSSCAVIARIPALTLILHRIHSCTLLVVFVSLSGSR